MSTEAALLGAITAEPDDDTARLVYADFLEEKGGESDVARAQFIRAQVALARPPQKGESAKRREQIALAKRLFKRYGEEWAAPVFDALGTPNEKHLRHLFYKEWERGFFSYLKFPDVAAFRERAPAVCAVAPLTAVELRVFSDDDVRALAAEPLLRTAMRLRLFGGGNRPDTSFGDATAAVLAASPHLARIEELDFTQNRLTTEGVRALAHSPVMTKLKKLRLFGNIVSDDTYAMLVDSPLGARMTEWRVNGSFAVTSGAARVLARATHLTHITHLSFDNTTMADDGVSALAAAPHLASVRELDFHNSNVTGAGAQTLARAPVFADLERLIFAEAWIGTPGANALCRSKHLKKLKFLSLFSAVPESAEKKLRERFGRKVEFGRL